MVGTHSSTELRWAWWFGDRFFFESKPKGSREKMKGIEEDVKQTLTQSSNLNRRSVFETSLDTS